MNGAVATESDNCPTCGHLMNLDCFTYIYICRKCAIELPPTADMVDRDATTTSAPQLESVHDTSVFIGRCYGANNLNYLNNWHKSPQLKMLQMMTREFNQISMGQFNQRVISDAIDLFIQVNNLLDSVRENRNIVRALPRRKLVVACICHAFVNIHKIPVSFSKFAKLFKMKRDDIKVGFDHLQTLGVMPFSIPLTTEVELVLDYFGAKSTGVNVGRDVAPIIIISSPRIIETCIGKFNQTAIIVALALRLLRLEFTPAIAAHFDISPDVFAKISRNISEHIHQYFNLKTLRDMHDKSLLNQEEISLLIKLLTK